MKKCLLTIFAMVSVTLGMNAAVGDDITSKYLTNANFSQDTPVEGRICTYDYDMGGGTYSMFGQQAVIGWTALNPSDNVQVMASNTSPVREDGANARAAGVFAIGAYNEDEHVAELGGTYYAPDFNSEGEESTGNALGLIAVWGAKLQYTQAVTLPAGCYTIQIPTWNAAGTGTVSENLFGFIADDGTKYVTNKTSWSTDAEWMMDEVTFILDEETSGVISLGYVGPSGSGSMPHLFIDYVKIFEADPAPVIQKEIDELKEDLLPLLEAGDELGVSTKEGWTVYNDSNATLEQVKNAIDTQKELNEKGMTDFTDFFLNNAHFDQGTPLDNGVCTYAKDMQTNETTYFGMQEIPYWTASSPGTDAKASGLFAVGAGEKSWMGSRNQGYVAPATKANGATEGNVFGFVGCWGASASYTQNVTLPAGSYTITIPTYNSKGGTTAIAKNLCGFIASDGTEYLAETKVFAVDKWSNETIKFTLDEETEGVISIGYAAANAGSGSMPHLFIDEFTLKYNGQIDIKPSLLSLQGAVRSAAVYEDFDNGSYEKAIQDKLIEAVEEGQALVSSSSEDDDANVKAATAINNAVTEVKASMAVYSKFLDFIEGTLTDAITKYDGSDLAEFAGTLSDERDQFELAYEEGEYSTEQINEIINGFNDRVAAEVKTVLATISTDGKAHNLDVSCLFNNIDFAKSTVDGWANETGTTAFLSRVQTAEVWNQSNFNVSLTLADMPAGVYELQTPGFYRTAGNADNYAQYLDDAVSGKAYVYVGENMQLMRNVCEFIGAQDDNHTAAVEDGVSYVPNSNNNAHYLFYDQTDVETVNTVCGALAEAGDLTIGVKGVDLSGNAWVVWGASKVIYKGADGINAVLYEALMNKAEQASEMLDAAAVVVKADDKLNDALSVASDCTKDSSVEELNAAMKQLDEAMDYAKESSSLYNKISELYTIYAEYIERPETGDESFDQLMDEVGEGLDEGFEDNAAIESYIKKIPAAWTAMCQYDGLNSATEEEPYDMSAAIINNSFEGVTEQTGNAEFWSVVINGGGVGYQAGIYENYNSNTFNVSQTISGLAKGYYKIRVQSFYRRGSNVDNASRATELGLDSCKNVILYAQTAAGMIDSVYVKNQLEKASETEEIADDVCLSGDTGAEPAVSFNGTDSYYVPNVRSALSIYFEQACYWNELVISVDKDGTDVTIGLKKDEHVANDWCPFDNFQLLYLGTTAPVAVENVEAAVSAADGKIYDLSGRRVNKAQKGIYILNGKKFVK